MLARLATIGARPPLPKSIRPDACSTPAPMATMVRSGTPAIVRDGRQSSRTLEQDEEYLEVPMTIRVVSIAAALLALASVGAPPAAAEIYRPWCVQYFGRGGTTCAFESYTQCMDTARGGGGYCSQNPWYLYHGQGPSAEVPSAEVSAAEVPRAKVSKVDRSAAKPRQIPREPARVRKPGDPVFQ
jgi:hypothetical protein